ncbi:unnamed protein product [Laminaria digitata]
MHRRFLKVRDAFPKSADEHAQQVARLLQHRRAELNAAWRELEEGWSAIYERMAEYDLRPRTDEESMVNLNVGGSNVTLFWHLLAETEGFEDSILGALLEGVWGEGRIPRDADGRIVLDESPACIKHIIVQTMLRAKGRTISSPRKTGAEGLPESTEHSAVAIDEAPCLTYTACVVGLPGYVPAHSTHVKINGGSTMLEPFEIAPFSATIRHWVGGSTDEMTLLYRATRDGFGVKFFKGRCTKHSPNTITLIRVSSGEGKDDDSIVGGYSSQAWDEPAVSSSVWASESEKFSFVFMLKDGTSTRKGLCKPIKWDAVDGTYKGPRMHLNANTGPCFGVGDLITNFGETPLEGCTIETRRETFGIGIDSPFLALNGKKVVDIEVYRCSKLRVVGPPKTTAPKTTGSGGDALTDAEAFDIRSFGETIATSLMEERVVLDRAVKEKETASARVAAATSALETVYGPSVALGRQDAVVDLNVHGTKMTTLRSTLQACPRSALARMFDEERWPATDKDKDEHGGRLIDCDPTCFSKILDVLRMQKRASWSRRLVGEKHEGKEVKEGCGCGVPSGAIFIKEADGEVFGETVNMYFPGCESFIMDLVQQV